MKYTPPLGSLEDDAPYVDGNPSAGIRGSVVPAAPFNQLQRELVNVISSAGLEPSDSDMTQVWQALKKLFSISDAEKWRKSMIGSLVPMAVSTLPGGFGTLDEFFDALCLLQIRNHRKPCGLLNVNGYYDDLLRFLRNACGHGLLRDTDLKLINVRSSPAELLDALCGEVEGREPFFSRTRTTDAFAPESAHGKNAWQQKRIPETCL